MLLSAVPQSTQSSSVSIAVCCKSCPCDELSYGLRPLPPAPDHCSLLEHCRFLALWQADLWDAWWLHFGVLGDPEAILGHWGTQERTLWGPGLEFYRCLVSLETLFWQFFEYIGQDNVYLVMLVSRFFSNGFWVWTWMSRIGKLSILQARYCTKQLSQKLEFSWFQNAIFMILGGIGIHFHVDLGIFGI